MNFFKYSKLFLLCQPKQKTFFFLSPINKPLYTIPNNSFELSPKHWKGYATIKQNRYKGLLSTIPKFPRRCWYAAQVIVLRRTNNDGIDSVTIYPPPMCSDEK